MLRADLLKLGAKQRDLDNMREGMRLVVAQGGTGTRAASTHWVVAGKTGTAQKERWDPVTKKWIVDNRTLFVAFAPYEAPKIAVSVFVMNGEAGGKTAAPIAKRVIEQTLATMAGTYSPSVHALEPAKGHFDKINEVIYPGENVPAVEDPAEEGETAEPADEASAAKPAPVAAAVQDAPPKAVIIEEDDTKVLTHQALQPVKFRIKTDPPNPPRQPLPEATR